MRFVQFLFLAIALLTGIHTHAADTIPYTHGPDSLVQDGVPKGIVTQHQWNSSTVYEGTTRDYWVYVPAQYDAAKPACVMVFQDGASYVSLERDFRTPTVFDNLIHKGEMPVTIGIFINPGVYPAAFHKVISHVGNFTNIRGGHAYPSMIRLEEKRDIRAYLQAGNRDLNNRWGSWPLGNLQMATALGFSGYDHKFVMGTEGHNAKHGDAILPEMLRWTWRDYPGVKALKEETRTEYLQNNYTVFTEMNEKR